MIKRLYSITVKGKRHTWVFNAWLNPAYLDEWRQDGLIIDEIINSVPVWVVEIGLARPWMFMQDIFNLRFKDLPGYFKK